MIYPLEELTGRLKASRSKKGMSQRAFARSIGMPQSRLSKIENGLTDLQTTSLLELARNLDLELMLVPRQAVPAVEGLVRRITEPGDAAERVAMYDLGVEEDHDG